MSPEGRALLPWIGGLSILAVTLGTGTTLRGLFQGGENRAGTAGDAPLGKEIHLPNADVFSKPILRNGRTLLIFAGSCTGCSADALSPSELSKVPYDHVALIYLSSRRELVSHFQDAVAGVQVIADPRGTIVSELGAVTAPRFYVLENGRISDIWKDTAAWPTPWLGERK